MTFPEYAKQSAQIYLKYLTEQGKGIIEAPVTKVEDDNEFITLTLGMKLLRPDEVQIKIYNVVYSQFKIEPVSYCETSRKLIVKLNRGYERVFDDVPLSEIYVISDLRFLVDRVQKWYSLSPALHLPKTPPKDVCNAFSKLNFKPSDSQSKAIDGVLSSPFSYVWGAPGTGKTKFVLARCVLACIKSKKRVLITAPTNNALEQSLEGILQIFSEAGEDLEQVIRLGVPSDIFLKKYPQVCERAEYARAMSKLNDHMQEMQINIKNQKALLDLFEEKEQYLNYEKSFKEFNKVLSKVVPVCQRAEICIENAENENHFLKGKITIAQNSLADISRRASSSMQKIAVYNSKIQKYENSIFRIFLKNKIPNLLVLLAGETSKVDEYNITKSKLNLEIDSHNKKILENSRIIDSAESERKKCLNEITKVSLFEPKLKHLAEHISEIDDTFISKCETIITEINDYLVEKRVFFKDIENRSYDSLKSSYDLYCTELNNITEKINELNSSGMNKKISSYPVVAATIDTCLNRISTIEQAKESNTQEIVYCPDLVFLDEAGYCSLIKAATLTAFNCPMALFGDHMQLPPVCEMNDSDFLNEIYAPVFLWSQSALHLENIFVKTLPQMLDDYLNNVSPDFVHMKKYELVQTYRFGEKLASVLAKKVYPSKFCGSSEHETDIFYINASYQSGELKRTNISECNAIKAYCDSHYDENIGIITPYKHQRGLIKKVISKDSDLFDSVLTVHGSQGREWDTVLFSIVDTSDMWFSNSNNPVSNGKKIINTAVSRAKKKLVIICDASYWYNKNGQLISELLQIAEEIKL